MTSNAIRELAASRPLLSVVIPVRQGRIISVIVEVAARNQLLKAQGHHSALDFQERLMERFRQRGPTNDAHADDIE